MNHSFVDFNRVIGQDSVRVDGLMFPHWIMEDKGFKQDRPRAFRAIAARLKESRMAREKRIKRLSDTLALTCKDAGLIAQIAGRPKHIFSIFKKMEIKGLDFKDILDLNGIRVIVQNTALCYTALDLVHHLWTPIPQWYDDYIKAPKKSGYRSLHTTVRCGQGLCIEVQIRSLAMHRKAQSGRAAHWRNKLREYG